MDSASLERRLAAVLYADVAGYSRLMGEDEEGTHRTVSAFLDHITERILMHNGQVGHYAGDAILAHFDLVLDALACALGVQADLCSVGDAATEDRQVRFRIGINLGDVIVDRGEIYGDGVNVAARLEALAEPGGVCVSESVRAAVGSRLPVDYEFMGEQAVKNIAEPVRAYHARPRPGAEFPMPARPRRRHRTGRLLSAVGVLALTAVLGGIGIGLRPWSRASDRTLAQFHVHRPSIAVLPFDDQGAPPDEAYFSDGITNDIIVSLSRFSNLVVIASHSIFAYKGKPANVKQVASQLGVRYVMVGRLQRAGDRLRVSVQLVEAATGSTLWSERYDRVREDVFDLQDEITRSIVRTLAVKLTKIEQQRAFSKPTRSLQAYEYVLRGQALVAELDRRANFQAREMFRKAIEIDPTYSDAYAGLGSTYQQPVLWGWTGSPTRDVERALELARHALLLDDSNLDAHRLIARIHTLRHEFDAAIITLERVIALNPNDAQSHAEQGVNMLYAGQTEGAVRSLEAALRLDPGMGGDYMMHLGMSYFLVGRYPEAVATLERTLATNPDNVYIHIALTAAYVGVSRLADARREADAVRRLDPFFSIAGYGGIFRDPDDAGRIIAGLRTAGLE